MNNSQRTRQYVEIALFGAVGGALEAVLGSITHSFRFIPFAGLIPATALIFILAVFFTRNNSVRNIAFCGATIAVLKLLSPIGSSLFPVAGVLIETTIICLIFLIIPGPVLIRIMIAGAAISLWPVCHKIIHLTIFMDIASSEAINNLAAKLSNYFGTENMGIAWVILPLILLHFTIGATGGALGWLIGKKLQDNQCK